MQDVEILWAILRFLGTTTAYGKIFKILFQMFSSKHRSTFCFQISCNLSDDKSVKSCVAYLIKKT